MSLQNKTIAFIGAGNMGEALIRGLLAAGTVRPQQIMASDLKADRLQLFSKAFGICTTTNNAAAVAAANIILLAVKPQQITEVLGSLRDQMTMDKLLISIVAGVPTARIEEELGNAPRVIRVMPNTPALVGAGAAALCKGKYATDDDLATAEAILDAVGITVRTEEKFLDAITALSGSGPAYIFLVTEAMIKAGIEVGLEEDVATTLTIQTVLGAAKLMLESGEPPADLRRNVTSPGGTTEAALQVMNDRKLVDIFVEAIKAAARRSKELSGA
ncbi:MAG: pyrroline-5-carboxylate reductase [Verrucomicrobiia bacterium]